MNDKIASLVGFAEKSGKIVIGADRLLRPSAPKCGIVFADRNVGENTLQKVKRHCEATHAMLIGADFESVFRLGINGCKILGLTDESMCAGIRSEIERNENYGIILGGKHLG